MLEISLSKPVQFGRRSTGCCFLLAALLALDAAARLKAQTIVVPNTMVANAGDTPISVPAVDATIRFMLMYDAAQFTDLSGPSYLTQFAFRPSTSSSPGGPRQITFRLYASTTKRMVDEMSTKFSENTGNNRMLVFDGSLILSSENLAGPEDTRQFDMITPLTTPFLYDPAAGNLVLDLQVARDGGLPIEYDGVTENPALRGLASFDNATAPSGEFVTPQITQFTFAAPPLVTIRQSQVEICWNSKSNLTYQVQYRSELTTNIWTSLVDCVRASASVTCLPDAITLGQPQRFYRVVSTNCVSN